MAKEPRDACHLAAVNGPALSVVAGPHATIEAFEKTLLEKGLECRRLHTSHAFHSSMMDPVLEPFRKRVRASRLRPPGIPFISNVTGSWIREQEALDPEYWVQHLRNPVRFAEGVSLLLGNADQALLEYRSGSG